jgi:hypothetical protein
VLQNLLGDPAAVAVAGGAQVTKIAAEVPGALLILPLFKVFII